MGKKQMQVRTAFMPTAPPNMQALSFAVHFRTSFSTRRIRDMGASQTFENNRCIPLFPVLALLGPCCPLLICFVLLRLQFHGLSFPTATGIPSAERPAMGALRMEQRPHIAQQWPLWWIRTLLQQLPRWGGGTPCSSLHGSKVETLRRCKFLQSVLEENSVSLLEKPMLLDQQKLWSNCFSQ